MNGALLDTELEIPVPEYIVFRYRTAGPVIRLFAVLIDLLILVGTIILVLLLLGLAMIAESMDGFLTVLKYLGGTYLIWLGIRLWKSKPMLQESGNKTTASITSSFITGLLITLGDQKAILFYLVFFPAFIDLSKITPLDAAIIVIIATVSVGGAKLGYAFIADKSSLLLNPKAHCRVSAAAATVMVFVGLFLILKT